MEFRRVDISRFRNIDRAEINFAPGLNFIYGGNGSGKSSLLEALYLLSCGRSFRTARDADYVKTGAAHTVVSAQLKTEAGGQQRVGMSRRVGFNEYRFNGSKVGRLGALASQIPVASLSPEGCSAFRGGARGRRQVFEWGLFHVEPRYGPLFAQYAGIRKQRDEGLRRQDFRTDEVWLRQLAPVGEQLNELRLVFVDLLTAALQSVLTDIGLPGTHIGLRYRRGWQPNQSLLEGLLAARDGDRKQRRTTVGPHRYDLSVVFQEESEVRRLSLGQLKFALILIRLAQVLMVSKTTGQTPVLLLDDFYSELDDRNANILLDYLRTKGYQVLLTDQGTRLGEHADSTVFYVESGALIERPSLR